MKNIIDTSRRKTPWDNAREITHTQKFIKEKYQSDYKKKHPKLAETDEATIINNTEIRSCPYCEADNIRKYGKTKNKIQRYYCNICHRTFTPTACTIFEDHKISISEWIEFSLNIINYGSITMIAKVNKNGINTSMYWLNKLFLILKEYQDDIILKGKVFIDETFFSVIYSEKQQKDGKFLRGLSKDKFCIGIGCDGKNTIDHSN